jgi:hypothetical protein
VEDSGFDARAAQGQLSLPEHGRATNEPLKSIFESTLVPRNDPRTISSVTSSI